MAFSKRNITLQRERFKSKRTEEEIFVDFGQMAQRRIVLKLSSRRRTDWRILSIFGFAPVNWFLIDSYKKRAWKIWEQSDSWRHWWRTKAKTNEEQTRLLTSSSPPHRNKTASGKAESVHSQTFSIPTTSNWRESEFGTSMRKLGWKSWSQSSSSYSHKNGKNKYSDPCSHGFSTMRGSSVLFWMWFETVATWRMSQRLQHYQC